jgi:hypothetical protein
MKKPSAKSKEPKEVKTRKVRGPKPPASKVAGSNMLDPDKRALFLKDKEDYAKAIEKLSKAQSAVRTLGKTIKSDGFTLRQIKFAIQLDTPEGEAEFKSLIANDLLAAQYAGAPIGSQLTLFLEPDRTPAVDIAAGEGQADAMANKVAKPKYDPATPQAKSYMDAYHAEQGRQLKAGIKPLADGDPPRATSEMN